MLVLLFIADLLGILRVVEEGGQDAHPTRQKDKIINYMKEKEPTLKITQRDLPHWELDGAVYFITFNTWEKLELTLDAREIVFSTCKFF